MTELEAIARMARTVKNFRFLMVGEGPERAKLEAFINAYPEWKDRVSLPGLTRRVPELLQAMDVFILSSVTEGICNSLLEAMATGLPVIATDTGGNPEVVVSGESGLLFPVGGYQQLADKLLLLQQQTTLRVELGSNAVRRIRQEYSVDSMAKNYDQVYTSLTSAARAADH
jgi:glycosyltransferase involved in cell wall biosynthesis